MSNYKLILEDTFEEDFTLIAIHCSEDCYKVAYLLNQFLQVRLHRSKTDLEYSEDGLEITFPLYDYEDEMKYTSYNLIANICKNPIPLTTSSGGLFENEPTESSITSYLVPEMKQVDFFIKIVSDFETIPLKKILSSINEIKQVISAYSVDIQTLKSKNNLIFD
ncbi:IPExxxVDY family protein [Patiriisocius hiemis]|uniref:IPExxxVDY family protein n=1 Tax=Patiriisocius hiemis TaxID=3075604 RepID=A0ABU2YBV5_9FLAO|nr:IPExxxVDY family protein [Constantimarinum sp. W242]MDT0555668.1 IPExxxVDY family protein [Constantimarinum sp. W242]